MGGGGDGRGISIAFIGGYRAEGCFSLLSFFPDTVFGAFC